MPLTVPALLVDEIEVVNEFLPPCPGAANKARPTVHCRKVLHSPAETSSDLLSPGFATHRQRRASLMRLRLFARKRRKLAGRGQWQWRPVWGMRYLASSVESDKTPLGTEYEAGDSRG